MVFVPQNSLSAAKALICKLFPTSPDRFRHLEVSTSGDNQYYSFFPIMKLNWEFTPVSWCLAVGRIQRHDWTVSNNEITEEDQTWNLDMRQWDCICKERSASLCLILPRSRSSTGALTYIPRTWVDLLDPVSCLQLGRHEKIFSVSGQDRSPPAGRQQESQDRADVFSLDLVTTPCTPPRRQSPDR